MGKNPNAQTIESSGVSEGVRHLVEVALNGLPQMFDSRTQLFCHKLKRTDTGMVQEGLSPRYTAMTLMGLSRLQQRGVVVPFEVDRILEGLVEDTTWIDNIGDLGLLLWTCAVVSPQKLSELDRRLDISTGRTPYPLVEEHRSMELAWYLAGISHWALAQPELATKLRQQAFDACALLLRNQGTNGVFGHLAKGKGVISLLRGNIGSFADQVYPIYAISKFYAAYGDAGVLQRAVDCAHMLCEFQGELGQWWWHYDSQAGRVRSEYPVFSVHQHGMAPMTLFALNEVTQENFDHWIYKGLGWIRLKNELKVDMEDRSANVIWRCIHRTGFDRFWPVIDRRRYERTSNADRTNVLYECRPYELGWLLYAFADKIDDPEMSSESGAIVENAQFS